MLFNSFEFWLFFAIVLFLYRALSHKGQNYMLLVASYVFYGFWDWRFLFLILLSTVIDYVLGLCIQNAYTPAQRRTYLGLSICASLGILGFFKYYNFFTNEFAAFLHIFGLSPSLPTLNIILPVGISFYTFQTMSYTIDVYRGEIQATRNFRDFALFVAFFPQLVAGPIERASNLLPQVLSPRTHTPDDFSEGLYYVLLGLFKKVVIADNMAPIVNTVFASGGTPSGAECLIGLYAFAFQIYGDFSGYSSIAQGIARWLGFDLMTNFETPYFATSIREFWRRWHISLSTWLRDYLYVPLGGSRHGKWHTYRNLMLTMVLGGLWHGAAWTFIAWGFFHGALLGLQRAVKGSGEVYTGRPSSAKSWILMLVTFNLVCLGWLMFRAESMTQAWNMLTAIFMDFRVTAFALSSAVIMCFYVGPLVVYEWWTQNKPDVVHLMQVNRLPSALGLSYCLLMLWFFPSPQAHEFIYFQF